MLCLNEVIGKIIYRSKTCLTSLLKYHIDDCHKLQIFIITISMLASENKQTKNNTELIGQILFPSWSPAYRDHMLTCNKEC